MLSIRDTLPREIETADDDPACESTCGNPLRPSPRTRWQAGPAHRAAGIDRKQKNAHAKLITGNRPEILLTSVFEPTLNGLL